MNLFIFYSAWIHVVCFAHLTLVKQLWIIHIIVSSSLVSSSLSRSKALIHFGCWIFWILVRSSWLSHFWLQIPPNHVSQIFISVASTSYTHGICICSWVTSADILICILVNQLLNFIKKSLMFDFDGISLPSELSSIALAKHKQQLFTSLFHIRKLHSKLVLSGGVW